MRKTFLFAAVAFAAAGEAIAAEPPVCGRTCTPAEWQRLSVDQRAEMWPLMSRDGRRRIYRSMPESERADLRERLRPLGRSQVRQGLMCPASYEDGPRRREKVEMGPGERRHMRDQISEFHYGSKGGPHGGPGRRAGGPGGPDPGK